MADDSSVPQLVDHLFRHQAGQMVSSLTRLFGVENLELVEDIVQETLLKALQQWPYRGIPENPGGWLWKLAKNHALDVLRREAMMQKKFSELAHLIEAEQLPAPLDAIDHPLGDDQLSMMFIGCHPSLSREVQVALVLKTVSGFNVAEIARAFLLPETTIAQRLVRAKNRLRSEGVRFELPATSELLKRLDAVLEVLYLLFNEGYDAHLGETLVRKDLCLEAIYLCRLVAAHPIGRQPQAHALLALMLLQASRLNTRADANGDIILLAEQDRSLWDREMIQAGLYHLGQSAEGIELSKYHLQAGIAAKHAVAENYESTDWPGILGDYETLVEIAPTPIVLLNFTVAFAMVHGPQAGLNELFKLKNDATLQKYHLLHATLGELYERSGDFSQAAKSYDTALALATNEVERRFLQRKLTLMEGLELSGK